MCRLFHFITIFNFSMFACPDWGNGKKHAASHFVYWTTNLPSRKINISQNEKPSLNPKHLITLPRVFRPPVELLRGGGWAIQNVCLSVTLSVYLPAWVYVCLQFTPYYHREELHVLSVTSYTVHIPMAPYTYYYTSHTLGDDPKITS